jgi:flagellar assembly protein FliH
MRWSDIVKVNRSEAEQAEVTVLNYTPKQFNFGTPESALEYLKEKDQGSDFVMSDILRTTTGVEEIERLSEEQKIEEKVLEKISFLQEDSYKQAYDLGFAEGTKKAIEDKSQELANKSADIDALLLSLNQIKAEMAYQNEAHMIKMIYEIASRLAFDHVTEHQEIVLKLIKKSIDEAQDEENVNVLVSNEQLEFLEKIKQSEKRENEFLKKVKFVGSETVSVGSCVVETNYGVIDARIEERVTRLWNELKQAAPKVKSPIEPS